MPTVNQSLPILDTQRLRLRELSSADAPFVLNLLNQPSFIRHIGDKEVRTEDDAVSYILNGPVASYKKFGFGLWLVETKESEQPAGICGLLKREILDDVDVGYALLPDFWSRGYALESVSAVIEHAKQKFGLSRVVAVVNPDNTSSIKLLEKVGFVYERMVRLSDEAPEVKLFARQL